MADNSQSRKWQLTINNPKEHEITYESLREQLDKFALDFYCMCTEIGNETNTEHIHIFMYSNSPVRFSTIKSRIPTSHIEKAYGSIQQNIDYIKKEGDWENTDKKETSVEGSFYQKGEVPSELIEKDYKMGKLLEDIKDGKTSIEIIEDNPTLAFQLHNIDTIRLNYLSEKYSKEFRDVKTFFIFGSTATYKTSYVYKRFESKDVFRIYNYQNLNSLWDGYANQKVVLFDEFNGQIPIELMLILTDKFPILNLSARYNNKIAMYEYVFFCSNTNYYDVYSYEKTMKTSTWKAWDRRIQNIWEFKKNQDSSPIAVIHKGEEKEENIYELQRKKRGNV